MIKKTTDIKHHNEEMKHNIEKAHEEAKKAEEKAKKERETSDIPAKELKKVENKPAGPAPPVKVDKKAEA